MKSVARETPSRRVRPMISASSGVMMSRRAASLSTMSGAPGGAMVVTGGSAIRSGWRRAVVRARRPDRWARQRSAQCRRCQEVSASRTAWTKPARISSSTSSTVRASRLTHRRRAQVRSAGMARPMAATIHSSWSWAQVTRPRQMASRVRRSVARSRSAPRSSTRVVGGASVEGVVSCAARSPTSRSRSRNSLSARLSGSVVMGLSPSRAVSVMTRPTKESPADGGRAQCSRSACGVRAERWQGADSERSVTGTRRGNPPPGRTAHIIEKRP